MVHIALLVSMEAKCQSLQRPDPLPRWTAAGFIVDEDGKPLADVSLTPSLYDAVLDQSARNQTVTTDTNGHWRWSISANPNTYCLRASKPGYSPREVPLQLQQVSKIELATAPSIQGYAVDDQDREVEGATIAIAESGTAFSYRPNHKTISDNRGWFHLSGVVEPVVHLRAWKPNGQAGQLNGHVASGNQAAVIELAPPTTLELKVVDVDDHPIAGAALHLRSWNRTGVFKWSARTDSQGMATWSDSPQGLLAFEAICDGYHPTWKRVQVRGPQQATIRMQRVGATKATIVDDETGHAVERFAMLCTSEKTHATNIAKQELVGWHSTVHIPKDAIVGEQAALPLESIPFFDFVDVEVCALGFNRYKMRLDNQTDLTSAPELRLKQPNIVSNETCRIVDRQGQGITNALVMYVAQGGITIAKHSDPIANQLQWPYHIHQQYSDINGNFRRNARSEYEFVSVWTDNESYLGLSRNLSPEKEIALQPYSSLTLSLSPEWSQPFVQLSIRQSIYLDAKKNHAQAHFYSPMVSDLSTGRWICDRVPAGNVSIVHQVFDPVTKKFRSLELASLTVESASKRELHYSGRSTLNGRLQIKDERLSKLRWECVATTKNEQYQEMRFYRCAVDRELRFQLEHLPAADYLIEWIPVSPATKEGISTLSQMKITCSVANPIRIAEGQSLDIGNIEISWLE